MQKRCELSDSLPRWLAAVHGRDDGALYLLVQFFDLAVPGPRIRQTNAQQSEHALRRSIVAVPERIEQAAVAVPVSMTGVAAHPAIAREPGVIKQQLSLLAGTERWLRAECDLR